MTIVAALLVGAVVLTPTAQGTPPVRLDCSSWSDCRQRALDAAERRDYEAFHDFAWRAAQQGAAGDPESLFLVARAQSLSGRPHDALVMLRRLAAHAVAREALTSDDFARVRALAAWPDVEAAIKGEPGTDARATSPEPREASPARAPIVELRPPGAERPAAAGDALTFNARGFTPAALAYDRVSKRFIIADSDISRLAVIDEFTHNVATLASGAPDGGFGAVTAIEIDPAAGDLWVASVDAAGKAALHKLQLISARVLKAFELRGAGNGPLRDLAVAPDGSIVAVDGTRILRLRRGAAAFDTVATVDDGDITSVAISSDGGIYVAQANRIRRVGAGGLNAAAGIDVPNVAKMRWSRGSIVALQADGGGLHRLVRIRVSRDGLASTGLDVLDASVRTAHPAMTLVDGILYYLAEGDGAGGAIIRRAKL